MKKRPEQDQTDDLRPQYDFSQLKGKVRGKYAKRYREGTNLIPLAPDVAQAFPDADTVNEALRMLIRIARSQASK